MPEIYSRQPEPTYSIWGPFTKNKERRLKFKETEDLRYTDQNELDNGSFEHNMACGDLNPIQLRHFWGCSWMQGVDLKKPPCLKFVAHILQ